VASSSGDDAYAANFVVVCWVMCTLQCQYVEWCRWPDFTLWKGDFWLKPMWHWRLAMLSGIERGCRDFVQWFGCYHWTVDEKQTRGKYSRNFNYEIYASCFITVRCYARCKCCCHVSHASIVSKTAKHRIMQTMHRIPGIWFCDAKDLGEIIQDHVP